jgi:hypothetical protein
MLPLTPAAVCAPPPVLFARHPDWPEVRAAHLLREPDCVWCGTPLDLEVHHVIPVGVDPTKELDPRNLMTFCRHDHWAVAHLTDWLSWNVHVRADVKRFRKRVKTRPRKPTMAKKDNLSLQTAELDPAMAVEVDALAARAGLDGSWLKGIFGNLLKTFIEKNQKQIADTITRLILEALGQLAGGTAPTGGNPFEAMRSVDPCAADKQALSHAVSAALIAAARLESGKDPG